MFCTFIYKNNNLQRTRNDDELSTTNMTTKTSNLSKAHETRDSLSSFYSQVVLV